MTGARQPVPGAVFPTKELPPDPEQVIEYAQTVERLGYRRLALSDHVLGAQQTDRPTQLFGTYDHETPFFEPLTLFAYLAAVTRSIELSCGVLVLPQRQTAVVAKQAAQIDLLSRERLVLGIGTGWNYVEFDALGVDFASRGRLMDEQIGVLRRLWTDPLVECTGEFHRLDRVAIAPLPRRSIPIWMGGYSAPALRRAAALGDGFIFSGSNDTTRAQARTVLDAVKVNGRSVEDFGIEVWLSYDDGPDVWSREIDAWSDLRCTHVAVRTSPAGGRNAPERAPREGLRRHLDAAEDFMAWWRANRS